MARLVKGFHGNSRSPEAAHPHCARFRVTRRRNLRHKPMAATFLTTPKTSDRLAQLWEELRADPVPFQPVTKPGRTVDAPVLLRQDALLPRMAIDDPRPENRSWRVDLARLFQSLWEPAVAESDPASAVEAISEGEAPQEVSMAAAHEAVLALSTPFRWEPRPAWIAAPAPPNHQSPNTVHPQHFVARPKIPLRPLHKRPFYKRLFFYLRRWLNRPQ